MWRPFVKGLLKIKEFFFLTPYLLGACWPDQFVFIISLVITNVLHSRLFTLFLIQL